MRNHRIGAASGREAADLVSLAVGSNDILRRTDGDMIALHSEQAACCRILIFTGFDMRTPFVLRLRGRIG
jgi:hypothetical protein